jgi:hypothetical protein
MSDLTESIDILDLAAEAFDSALQDSLSQCAEQLRSSGEEPIRTFYLNHPEHQELRVYGVQGPTQHAVFSAVLGWAPREASFVMHMTPVSLRSGVLEEEDADAAGAEG